MRASSSIWIRNRRFFVPFADGIVPPDPVGAAMKADRPGRSGPDRDPHDVQRAADRLGLEPQQTIHRAGEALETLVEDDVAAGRPMLAALCVSKMRSGIPGRGFFLKAQVLGVFSGNPTVPEAHAFHVDELQRVLSSYGSQHPQPVVGGS